MNKKSLNCLVLTYLCVLASCGSALSTAAGVPTHPPTAPTASYTSQAYSMGSMTEFPIPTSDSFPGDIVAGPDGNLWFTEFLSNKIGRISPRGK